MAGEDVRRETIEERQRARAFVEQLDTDDLDKAQRKLRRKILREVGDAVDDEDFLPGMGSYLPHFTELYDSTRRAVALIDKLERTDLSVQQKSALSAATRALHLAEDAVPAALRPA